METKRYGKLSVRSKDRKIFKQRFWCKSCDRSFLLKKDNQRVSEATKRKLTKQYIEGRSSYRALANLFKQSKNTILKAVLEIVSHTVSSQFIAERFKPKWSGILSFDGKYARVFDWSAQHFGLTSREKKAAHKKVVLCGIDIPTKDIPYWRLGDEETMIDLVMYFEGLRELKYPLRVLVCDGNPDIIRAARKVYGSKFEVQLCHKHFLDNLKKYAKDESDHSLKETLDLIENIRTVLVKRGTIKITMNTEAQERIIDCYERNFVNLFTYAKHKEVPRTNNHIENYFKQLSMRLKTINLFQSRQNAEGYINALILSRRFTKFTCCRKNNKYKNGRAPLELAGCDITDIDYLNL